MALYRKRTFKLLDEAIRLARIREELQYNE